LLGDKKIEARKKINEKKRKNDPKSVS